MNDSNSGGSGSMRARVYLACVEHAHRGARIVHSNRQRVHTQQLRVSKYTRRKLPHAHIYPHIYPLTHRCMSYMQAMKQRHPLHA